jgi:hypothetical protein
MVHIFVPLLSTSVSVILKTNPLRLSGRIAPRIGIRPDPPGSLAFPTAVSDLAVGRTFLFGLGRGLHFPPAALAIRATCVPSSTSKPPRSKLNVPRSPGQGGIAGGEENQVIQVGAGHTECPFVLIQGNPDVAPQRLAALDEG